MQVVCNLKSHIPCFYPMISTAPWQEKRVLLFPFHGWAHGAGAHSGGAQPARFSPEGGGSESVWMDYMTPTRGSARRSAPLSPITGTVASSVAASADSTCRAVFSEIWGTGRSNALSCASWRRPRHNHKESERDVGRCSLGNGLNAHTFCDEWL